MGKRRVSATCQSKRRKVLGHGGERWRCVGPAHRRWRRAEWLRMATRRGGSSGDGAFETIRQRQSIGGVLSGGGVPLGSRRMNVEQYEGKGLGTKDWAVQI